MSQNHEKLNLGNLTKKDVSKLISDRIGLDPKDSEAIVSIVLDSIVDCVLSGHKVEFRSHFIIGSKVQKARYAQNPKTLEKVLIERRRVCYFKPGKNLKNLQMLD